MYFLPDANMDTFLIGVFQYKMYCVFITVLHWYIFVYIVSGYKIFEVFTTMDYLGSFGCNSNIWYIVNNHIVDDGSGRVVYEYTRVAQFTIGHEGIAPRGLCKLKPQSSCKLTCVRATVQRSVHIV